MARELRPLITLVIAVIALMATLSMLNQYGFVHKLASVLYKVTEVFGLVRTDPVKGPYLPIFSTNILLFLFLNTIFGYVAYTLISRWGTMFHGIFAGITMVGIFFIMAYINSVISTDKAAELFSYTGTSLMALIQLPLSHVVIKRSPHSRLY